MPQRGFQNGRALRAIAAAAAVSTCLLAGLPAAQAQDARAALEQAPTGAEAIVIVPNLAALSEQVSALTEQIGLPMPGADDPLASFKQSMGMVEGIDDDGSLLVIFPDMSAAMAEDREPQLLMLMPVSDYDAFVQSLSAGAGGAGEGAAADAAPPAEGVTRVTLPDGQQGYARKAGDYAVLGEQQELVQAYEAGEIAEQVAGRVGDLGARYLEEADALFYIDLEKLAPTLVPMIDEAMQEQAAAQGGAMADPTMQNAAAVMQMYGEAMKTLVNDGTGLLMTLDLTDSGVALTHAMGYKPQSTLANILGAGEEANTSALELLPDQPYIFAGALDMEALDIARLYRQMVEGLPAEGNPMLQNADQWMGLIDRVQNASMAFYAPGDQAMMTGSVLNTLTVLQVDEPQEYIKAFRAYVEQMDGMQIPLGPDPMAEPGQGEPMQISYTSDYNENVLQLDGQQVDQFQLTTNFPPEMMQQMGPAAGFMGMFSNYSGYVASKDGKVVITTVPDPQLVTAGFQAIEQGGGLGAAGGIDRIRDDALPPNPAFEGYLSFTGIAQAANLFLGMMGMPPIEPPADLPPVAQGLGVGEQSAAYRIFVPVETIQFVVQTAQEMQAQMGGMGGPQQGPGGPPPF